MATPYQYVAYVGVGRDETIVKYKSNIRIDLRRVTVAAKGDGFGRDGGRSKG